MINYPDSFVNLFAKKAFNYAAAVLEQAKQEAENLTDEQRAICTAANDFVEAIGPEVS